MKWNFYRTYCWVFTKFSFVIHALFFVSHTVSIKTTQIAFAIWYRKCIYGSSSYSSFPLLFTHISLPSAVLVWWCLTKLSAANACQISKSYAITTPEKHVNVHCTCLHISAQSSVLTDGWHCVTIGIWVPESTRHRYS